MQTGDFGYGWMMNLSDGMIRETRPVKENESFFDNFAFRTGTRVYINTPGGRRVGFTFDPIAEGSLFGTMFHPHFTADPGVYERLEVEDVPLRQNPDGTFKLYFGAFNYNPHVYTLITKDQVRYTYDQFEGLRSISDRNDVKLTYTDTGIPVRSASPLPGPATHSAASRRSPIPPEIRSPTATAPAAI